MLSIILLSVFGIANLFLGLGKSRQILMPAALFFLATALAANMIDWATPIELPSAFNNGMMVYDHAAIVFSSVMILSGMLLVPFAQRYIDDAQAQPAEYFSILIFSLVGGIMMTSYENMIMLFVGLEILSIAMYVLTGSDKRNLRSNEAALKYLLMGSFATGFLLFGVALLYGATGTFTLSGIAEYVNNHSLDISPMLYLGLIMVLIGILFKVSAAPFHFWTPDVYDGAPSLFTAFMSTVVKTAGFAALYKLLSASFTTVYDFWWTTIAAITVLTLIAGNITAVYQQSFKRMMAYSSISHAGYLLISVVAMNARTQESILFYSLAYSIATITAFGVLIPVAGQRGSEAYDAFNGLAKRNPLLAFAMAVSMCSLAGLPLTAGFFGKFFIFISALERGNITWLLVVAILMSAVGIYYYFRVIIAMYMKDGNTDEVQVSSGHKTVLIITTILTILLGLLPALVIDLI